jgi:hypothetical protein
MDVGAAKIGGRKSVRADALSLEMRGGWAALLTVVTYSIRPGIGFANAFAARRRAAGFD